MNIINEIEGPTLLEYLNNVLYTTRRTNRAYDEAAGKEGDLYTLELENTPGVKPYVQAQQRAEQIEHKILYYQGYRDCICLLKSLSVLPSENKAMF